MRGNRLNTSKYLLVASVHIVSSVHIKILDKLLITNLQKTWKTVKEEQLVIVSWATVAAKNAPLSFYWTESNEVMPTLGQRGFCIK